MTKNYCGICGHDSASVHLELQKYKILRCNLCNIVYLDYSLNQDLLSDFYSANYFQSGPDDRGYENYFHNESFLSINFKRRMKKLRKYVSGGNVLDLGCGYGFFLNTLGKGYNGYGLDISEFAVSIAQNKYNHNVKVGPLREDSYPEKFFSLVTMWDVIEHLPNPIETLRMVHKSLIDNGIISITTGDINSLFARISGKNWHLYNLPEHLWFFSQPTMRYILEKSGFTVIEQRYEWEFYSLSYILERISKKFFQRRIDSEKLPLKPYFDKISIPINLFDIMNTIARKNP